MKTITSNSPGEPTTVDLEFERALDDLIADFEMRDGTTQAGMASMLELHAMSIRQAMSSARKPELRPV